MKIGLFFGSFSPVHHGHMMIANYCAQFTGLEQVWLVPSPHNPLKDAACLLPEHLRLAMLRLALANTRLPLEVCTIEFDLPRPSYTIDTLKVLEQQYTQHEFGVIMGADSLASIERWKDWQQLLARFPLYVYPRMGFDTQALCSQYDVEYVPAPIIEVSSTFIRQAIQQGKDVSCFMPAGVAELLNH